jgi:hypothetical protein
VQVTYHGLSEETKQRLGDKVTRVHQHEIVKRGTPGAVPALAVDGPKVGALIFVRGSEATPRNPRAGMRPPSEDGKPQAMTLDERKQRLARRRASHVVQSFVEELRKLTLTMCESIARGLFDRQDATAKRFNPLALLLAFGTPTTADRNDGHEVWATYKALVTEGKDQLFADALYALVKVWIRRLARWHPSTVLEVAEDAWRICLVLGWNWNEFLAQTKAAIPTPKAWADQVEPDADTTPLDEIGVALEIEGNTSSQEEPPFEAQDAGQSSTDASSASEVAPLQTRRSRLRRAKRRKARAAAAA